LRNPIFFRRNRIARPCQPIDLAGDELAADNMPLIIWFEIAADPSAARVVDPRALSDTLGPGSRLAVAYVEITNDPIVLDIDKPPWYQA
jgi:hypothetical protein